MSIWQRILDGLGLERRETVNLGHPRDPVLREWFVGNAADSGEVISPDAAMRVTTVYACVALIAETVAALPLHVYRREAGETSKATDHPLYQVLHDMARPGLTAFEWREGTVHNACLRGDSFSRIVINGRGDVAELVPLHPDRMRVLPGATRPVYEYHHDDGGKRLLRDDEILRIPYKLTDGITAVSPIEVHRNTIGLALASQRYLSAFYRNSAQPKGAIKIPTTLSDEAVNALRSAWERRHLGPQNAGRLAILDGGMEWQAIGMSMDDAQYVELSGLGVKDVCRIFGVPPHKVADLSEATFSNIEQQTISFVQDTLLRWCRRIEARLNAYLLGGDERASGYYVAFDLKGLLRGDAAARSAMYQALFAIGAMSPNEVRAAEDMNPYEGGEAYFVQGGYVPVDQAVKRPAPPLSPGASGEPGGEADDSEDDGDGV